MANYHTELSCALEMPAEAGAYAVALGKAADELGRYLTEEEEAALHEELGDEIVAKAQEITDEHGAGSDCDWKYEEGKLFISSRDSAFTDVVVDILRETMEKFDLDGPYALEWAFTCSKPRTDGFGGGAVILTKNDERWLDTNQWINETLAELKQGQDASPAP